jgi:hypothetical protein
MSNYLQASKQVVRERKTKEWVNSVFSDEVVERLHGLEDEVKRLRETNANLLDALTFCLDCWLDGIPPEDDTFVAQLAQEAIAKAKGETE